ncbi:cell division protein FtsL, partial [Klebsiella oxytoca]
EKPKVERKKNVFTRLEKLVMGVLGAGVFGLLIANISMNIHLSSTNRELQDMNNQIAETEVVNENLQQNVQELSRYDRVYEIARQNGLELNEENIRNVEQ